MGRGDADEISLLMICRPSTGWPTESVLVLMALWTLESLALREYSLFMERSSSMRQD
jgi:hypothetical protein